MVAKKQLQVEEFEAINLANELSVIMSLPYDDNITGCSSTDMYMSSHYDNDIHSCEFCDYCGGL